MSCRSVCRIWKNIVMRRLIIIWHRGLRCWSVTLLHSMGFLGWRGILGLGLSSSSFFYIGFLRFNLYLIVINTNIKIVVYLLFCYQLEIFVKYNIIFNLVFLEDILLIFMIINIQFKWLALINKLNIYYR